MILVLAGAIMAGACSGDRPGSTKVDRPFQGLDQLVEPSDLSIIGRVTSVSELQSAPRRDHPESQVEFLEASVEVDRTLFGSQFSHVVVHVPAYYLANNGHRMVTKAPLLKPDDTAMLFLTQPKLPVSIGWQELCDHRRRVAVGEARCEGERVSVPYPESKPSPLPLDEVTAWIEEARLSLAKPGLLAGEVSGLDEGDSATTRLLYLGRSHREENGVEVAQWAAGNGP